MRNIAEKILYNLKSNLNLTDREYEDAVQETALLIKDEINKSV